MGDKERTEALYGSDMRQIRKQAATRWVKGLKA